MSIASRYAEMQKHVGNAYTEISRLGVDLTNVDKNIDNIADKLQDVYADLPKVTGEGSSLSLTPTRKGGLAITPEGACEQDTTAYLDIGTLEQGSINANTGNNATSNDVIRCVDFIPIKPNILYAISRNVSVANMRFRFYDSNKTFLGHGQTADMLSNNSSQYLGSNETSGNITIINTNVAYLRFDDMSNDLNAQYTISTQAPSPDYPQNIRVVTGDNSVVVQNKNLLPLKAYPCSTTANYAVATSSTEVTSPYTTPLNYRGVAFVGRVKAGVTYTFSSDIAPINYTINGIYKNLSDITTSSKQLEKIDGKTFTPNYDGYALICSTASTSGTSISWTYAQLEVGSTATTYVAHAEQTYTLHLGTNYLAGIGDYKDEIVGKTDEWKIRRNIGKVAFDGDTLTEVTTLGITYKALYKSYFPPNKIISSNNGLVFENAKFITERNDRIENCIYENNNNVVVIGSPTDTLDTIKAKFNGALLYYILATPVEIPITDTTLITDLNNMYQAMGYDGTTNMTITSNPSNAQMIASVSALKGE